MILALVSLALASDHVIGVALTGGAPQLIAGELRLESIPNLELGAGFGAFPVSSIAQSLYSFQPVPIDLQTSDKFNLYPSGTYSLSGLYAFARWLPWESGFFLDVGVDSVSFTAQLNGTLKNESLGTSLSGALSGTVSVTQPIVGVGPGYQLRAGEHLRFELGLRASFLLAASYSTNIGGSLAGFAALNSQAQANYDAAKNQVASGVSQAIAQLGNYKVLPSAQFSIAYVF